MYKKIIAEKAAKAKKNIIFRKVVHSLALTSALFASYITPANASPQDKMPSTVIVASVDAATDRKVKELMRDLKYGYGLEKERAVKVLGEMGPAAKDAIPILIKLSEQGIFNATEALGEIGYISMQDVDTINQLRDKQLNTIILSPAGSALALSRLINVCDKHSVVAAKNIVLLGALDSERKSRSIITLLSNGFVKEALLLELKYALKANEAQLAALLLITLSLLVSTKVKHRDKIAQLPSNIKFAVEHYIKAGNYCDRYFQPNAKDYFKFLLFSALFVIAAKLTPVKSDLVYYAEELWLVLNMLNLNKMQMSQLLRDIVSLVPNKIDSLILFHKDSPGGQYNIVFEHLNKLDTTSSYADAVIELLGKRKNFPVLIALLGDNNCYYAAKNALYEYGQVSPELIVRCSPAHVPEFFNQLKITDKGLTLAAIKNCDSKNMHQLAAVITNIDKDIVQALIESCLPEYVPELYNQLKITDKGLTLEAIKKCDSKKVYELTAFITNIDKDIVQALIEHCPPAHVPELYNQLKITDKGLTLEAIKKCDSKYMHQLAAVITNIDNDIFQALVVRCSPAYVPELYNQLKITDKGLTLEAIKKCDSKKVYELAADITNIDKDIVQALIEHCSPEYVPELYNQLKITDKGLTLEAIKKCDSKYMHQLAAVITNIDKDIVQALIEHSGRSSNMLYLYKEIPELFRTPEILKLLIAKSDSSMLNRIEQNINNNECQIEFDDDKEELLSLIINRAVRLEAERAERAEREAKWAAEEAAEAREQAAFEESQRWYR
ncbi:MAG TPA: hypothetical protein DCS13_07350 [Candidatus Margulisbacteria bacterium]|nr:hypothetical protein [Candidatus Margulisiibacteriota bacterium]